MLSAVVFDIKRFAIYDGPGIRTTIFFKGCSLNCKWCQNPEGINGKVELYYDEKKCINCSECIKVCPIKKINSSVSNRFSSKVECLNGCTICYNNCPSRAIYKKGESYCAEELVSLSLEDLDFYKLSGGGVTISGGEPLLQINFVEEFLKRLKDYNINVVVETAGYVKWGNFSRILKNVDIFYYDLKIFNEKKHIEYTSHSNKLILKNLIKLSKQNKEIIIRIPMIPNITDTEENLESLISFIKGNKLEKYQIEILPYNELAEVKYDKKGINSKDIEKYFSKGLEIQSKRFLFGRKKMFADNGLKTKVLSYE